jgi:uncharacterized protein YecE (DUF72 family)
MMRSAGVVRVGTAGWEHEVFNDCLYPAPSLKSGEKLAYYAQFFDTVEIRQTFWDSTIDTGEVREWIQAIAANKRFVFNLKLHSSFTHKGQITPQAATRVRTLLQELAKADRLGSLVAQFPFSFTNTSVHRFHLVRLSEIFRGFPITVELRHISWNQPFLLGFLSENALHPISADLPRMKQFMPFITGVVGDHAYVRLHGRNDKGWLLNSMDSRYDYLYNSREIREIMRRIQSLLTKCKEVTLICNNTTCGKAVANALQLIGANRDSRPILIPSAALRVFPFLEGSTGNRETDQMVIPAEGFRQAV